MGEQEPVCRAGYFLLLCPGMPGLHGVHALLEHGKSFFVRHRYYIFSELESCPFRQLVGPY